MLPLSLPSLLRFAPLARRLRLLSALLCALVCSAAPAASASKAAALAGELTWEVEPDNLIPAKTLASLRRKMPTISSADQVQVLAKRLAELVPLLRLDVSYQDGKVVFAGQRANIINAITIKVTSREFRAALRTLTAKYIGKADSEEIVNRILADITDYLQSKGFFKSSVSFAYRYDGDRVHYTISIDEDLPCHIAKVIDQVALPKAVDLDIQRGDICDVARLQVIEERIAEQLTELGYNLGTSIYVAKDYDSIRNVMVLTIAGTKGQKVTFSLSQNESSYWTDELEQAVKTIANIEQIPSEVLAAFRQQGYFDAKIISTESKRVAPDAIHLDIKVQPGRRFYIGKVRFEGNRSFTDKELSEAIDLNSLFSFSQTPLDNESIEAKRDKIKALYYRKGFWSAKVDFPRINKNQLTGETSLVFNIAENSQRVFDGLLLTGNEAIGSRAIEKEFPYKRGEAITWESLKEFQQQVRKMYIDMGYIDAKVGLSLIFKESYAKTLTTIKLDISEGFRKKFGTVTVVGLVRTKPYVVTREIRFKEGQWFDPKKVEETRLSLLNLGLFRSVNIIKSDGELFLDDENRIDQVIEITESDPGRVSFGPGLSVYDGLRYAVEASYLNLGGTARQIFGRASFSEEKRQETLDDKMRVGYNLSLGYTEPYIIDTPIDATISLSNKTFDSNRLWQSNKEAVLTFSHQVRGIRDSLKFSLFYSNKLSEILGYQDFSLFETDQVKAGAIGVSAAWDSRDSAGWTTEGFSAKGSYERALYSLGGDIEYYKWSLALSHYIELRPKWVLALGFNFTKYEDVRRILDGKESNILPVSERLHSGGAFSNRGYLPEFLGPILLRQDASGTRTTTLGGTNRGIYKTELRYLLYKDIALSGFLDMSNSFFSAHEIERFKDEIGAICSDNCMVIQENYPASLTDVLSDPRRIYTRNYSSYGLSLSWLSPIGVINLYYGLPLQNQIDGGLKRRKITNSLYGQGILNFNVGAEF